MPISFVDPATAPQGGLPASPLAASFTNALGAYGRSFPTAAERAEIALRNVQTQKGQQELGEPGRLADVFASALTPKAITNPDGTTSTTSTGDTMRANLPDLVRGITSEHVSNLPALALMVSSYMKGAPEEIQNAKPGTMTTQDQAMMGAGHPVSATPGGMKLEHALGTPEMRNREYQINEIMNAQGATRQQASAIVDHVIEGGLDPVTRQPYVLNKLDLMNGRGGAQYGNQPPAATNAPAADADYLTQLTTQGPGKPGGEVPLTAAPSFPTAAPSDVNIDFNKAYGGPSAIGKLSSMADAVLGNDSDSGAASDLSKANSFKSGYLAIMGQHPGFRNNATAQGLTINQLPDTGPVTDIEDIGKQALVKPADAAKAYTLAMNNVIQMRQADMQMVNDPTKPPEERISAQNRIRDEDNFIKMHGSDTLQASYGAAAGIPAAPTPQTNEQQLKTATTVVGSKAPTRSEFTAMKPGQIFPDAKGVLWQKQADGTAKKVQQ